MDFQWVPLLIALVGGGGAAAAYSSFRKAPAEAGRISVSAAEGAVIVQGTVIKDLQTDAKNMRNELIELREQVSMLAGALHDRDAELRTAREENAELRGRVKELEAQVQRLETNGVPGPTGPTGPKGNVGEAGHTGHAGPAGHEGRPGRDAP